MAVKKFAKQELAPSEMFEKLITDHLMPYAKQATQDEFHKLLHTPEVQNIFAPMVLQLSQGNHFSQR